MIKFLLLAILVLLVARAFWQIVDSVMEAAGGKPRRTRGRAPAVKLARDPVCGTFVSPTTAISVQSRGKTVHFCSEECRSRFRG